MLYCKTFYIILDKEKGNPKWLCNEFVSTLAALHMLLEHGGLLIMSCDFVARNVQFTNKRYLFKREAQETKHSKHEMLKKNFNTNQTTVNY